jgi:uncharacterized protein YcbX
LKFFVYPLKGAQGVSVDELRFNQDGLIGDRQFMVVDESGMFVAQRSERGRGVAIPEIALVRVELTPEYVVFRAPGMRALRIPTSTVRAQQEVEVQIWDERVPASDLGAPARRWFTKFLSQFRPGTYRLVRMPKAGRTTPDGEHWSGFADGYPVLAISQESLDELNRRILVNDPTAEPIGWDRVRPNVVYGWDGTGPQPEPFWEDQVILVVMPGITLEGKTKCARCIVTTTNQRTLERGPEPLRSLREFRREATGNKVYFGRNLLNRGRGSIRIGDPIYSELVDLPRVDGWQVAALRPMTRSGLVLSGVTMQREGRLLIFRHPAKGRLVIESSLADSAIAGDVSERWLSELLAFGQSGYRLVRRPN